MSRATRTRRILLLTSILTLIASIMPRGAGDLPLPLGPREASAEEGAIERQPVCVASTVRSAGVLGPALFYRRSRLPDGRIAVGYYAFYSEERPWGNNWLTWLVVPALAIDLVYTRALLVAPGAQRVAYGKGDVEGFRITYDVGASGRLDPVEGLAEDARHRPAHLDRSDLFAIDPDRPTVATDAWSHQLGARGVRAEDLVDRRCYGPGSIVPLTARLVRDFHLERRALAAAVGDPPRDGDRD